MIDLTNAPKDATHYYKRPDGSVMFYKINNDESRELHSWCDYHADWCDDSSGLAWLIDNLVRIEWTAELIEGQAYQFSFESLDGVCGVYHNHELVTATEVFSVKHCTNITKLVPGVK